MPLAEGGQVGQAVTDKWLASGAWSLNEPFLVKGSVVALLNTDVCNYDEPVSSLLNV